MDGTGAIERNREALVRIVASLVAMAGGRPTITRHLWVAILRLLRPAEAAARRLIIAAARGIMAPAAAPHLRKKPAAPTPADPAPFLRRVGIAVTGAHPPPRFTRSPSPASQGRIEVADGRGANPPPFTGEGDHAQRGGGGVYALRIPAFPLFDPPRRLNLSRGRRFVPAHAAPRIMFPGVTQPSRLPPPPPPVSPDDPISAAGVVRRLAALAAALEDLPGQARRFARRMAALDAAHSPPEASSPTRFRRTSPLRGGPPPGGRLPRYDAEAAHRRGRNIREIDEILAHAHDLALHALESPDTS